MSPELYRLLVIDRAWSPARYEHWLTETLTAQLTSAEPQRPLTFCVTAQVDWTGPLAAWDLRGDDGRCSDPRSPGC